MSRYIDRVAKDNSQSCDVFVLKKVFNHFKSEKLCFTTATAMGIVKKILYTIWALNFGLGS